MRQTKPKKVAEAVGRPASAGDNYRTPLRYRNSPVLSNLFCKPRHAHKRQYQLLNINFKFSSNGDKSWKKK